MLELRFDATSKQEQPVPDQRFAVLVGFFPGTRGWERAFNCGSGLSRAKLIDGGEGSMSRATTGTAERSNVDECDYW